MRAEQRKRECTSVCVCVCLCTHVYECERCGCECDPCQLSDNQKKGEGRKIKSSTSYTTLFKLKSVSLPALFAKCDSNLQHFCMPLFAMTERRTGNGETTTTRAHVINIKHKFMLKINHTNIKQTDVSLFLANKTFDYEQNTHS